MPNLFTTKSMLFFVAAVLTTHGWVAADFDNVRVQLLNGSSIRCSIETIDQEGDVSGRNIPTDLKLDQIVRLQSDRQVTSNSPAYHQLRIVGGGSLWVKSLAVQDDLVSFQSRIGLENLKLEMVQGTIWNETDRVREVLANPSPDSDKVIVETEKGERVVDGLLESIDGTHVTLNFKGKSRRISLSIVNAVISADLNLPSPAGPIADINLTDGSKIRGRIDQLSKQILRIELPGRSHTQLKTSYIANLSIKSNKLVFLSDLEPVEVQQKALFAVQRTWQRDRSIKGGPLTIGFSGSTKNTAKFEKGLGTQSYSRLVFANENDFDRFRAVVGIDIETKGRGDCVFSVVGDGVRLWSQRIRASDDPVSVSVDISGMKQIALVVDAGEQFDLSDHADWGMARFTKSN